MKILPTTKLGKWSVGSLAGFFLIFALTSFVIVGIFGQKGGDTFTDNLLISIPMASAFGMAIASFIIGIISIFKYKERSILVYASVGLGLMIALFLIGDLTIQH